MPTNRLAYTKNPASQPASGGVAYKANSYNCSNATSKVVSLNGTWKTDSISFTVDPLYRYTVHVRNSASFGTTSINIDFIEVYGEASASYLTCSEDSVGYRFGFNGQEKDNEITGVEGSHNTAEFWMYDTRLGRRWNVDPVDQVSISNYACFGNNPIVNGDPDGAYFWGLIGSRKEQRVAAREFQKQHGGRIRNLLSSNISVEYEVKVYGSNAMGTYVMKEIDGITMLKGVTVVSNAPTVKINQYFFIDGTFGPLGGQETIFDPAKFDTRLDELDRWSRTSEEEDGFLIELAKTGVSIPLDIYNSPFVYLFDTRISGEVVSDPDELMDATLTLMPKILPVKLPKGSTKKAVWKIFKQQTNKIYTRANYGNGNKKRQGYIFQRLWEANKAQKGFENIMLSNDVTKTLKKEIDNDK